MVPKGQAEIVVRTLPASTDEYAELDKITRDTEIVPGMVFTVEPFLSTGAEWFDLAPDGWTLTAKPGVLTVQYEHTVIATKRGPLIVTTVQ